MTTKGREVAIVGVGYSGIFRGECPTPEQLTVDACLNAINDAGLTAPDIDGVFEYQYANDAPLAAYVRQALGTSDLAAYGDIMGTGPSGLASVLAAQAAVSAGHCETAIAYRTIQQHAANTGSADRAPRPTPGGAPFVAEFSEPYGLYALIPNIGLKMRRREAEYGGSPEDYGYIAINARRWAADNERAIRRELITMDDYMNSRMLSDPLRLLDCDLPISACSAVIFTTLERARDLKNKPVKIDACAYAVGSGDWVHDTDFLWGGTRFCAERLWRQASVGPGDINVAQLYDGFTYMTLTWLEALGFCGLGEAGGWLEKGKTIGPGGKLPVNTHGGHLAEGRLHGLSSVSEAVLQLRGECGVRQVPNAEVAVVANSHGAQCGAMVLTT